MMQFRIALAATALGLGLFGAQSALAGPFYVTGSFGVNYDEDEPFAFVKEETGLVGAVAVGTHVQGVEGLRIELEASFRSHDIVVGPFQLEHDTTALMLNAVYDIEGLAIGRIVPYVLLGAGYAGTELTFGGIGPLTLENDGMGWQAGAGFNYQVSESVSAGLGYRFLEAPAVEIFGFELDGGGNHAVMAHVSVALN
jgi:opacity protein-like surface antigen